MIQMNPQHHAQQRSATTPAGVKVLAAALGTGALVGFGAIAVAATGSGGAEVLKSSPTPSMGETTTATTAPTTLATPFATPPITSTPADG
jgi:hypothetical protein